MERRKKGSGQITYVPDRKSPWRASVVDGQGKQKSRFFKTEKAAKAFLREVNADASKLKSLVEAGVTFEAFSQVFLAEKKKSNLKITSFNALEGQVERAAFYLGKVKLSDIDSDLVQQMIFSLAEQSDFFILWRRNPRVTVWEFSNPSIPLKVWEDKQLAIEAALDINIIRMKYGKSKSRVIIQAVPAKDNLPEHVEWQAEYLSPDSFVLVLGEGYIGPVTVDLAKVPHILLGGSTGSGKSVLLKLLLMQSLHKGAEVYIADFKGGVDFPSAWHEQCRMCFEEDDLIKLLTGLVDELERRKSLFKEAGCPNLDEYNKAKGTYLKRLVFACDEVAEILDKSGVDKARKDKLAPIESKLSLIARQGRAFGIHLILATQRPDANLIPGQIRTNLGCRICGRADSILSQIILDSTAAADQIPKEARGRFLLHDGTMFQSFLFDETTALGAGGRSIQAR